MDKLRDTIVLEQLLNWVWVQEHKPKTSEAAAQLADNYLQAGQIDPVVGEGKKPVTLLFVQSAKDAVTRRGIVELEWRSSPPPRAE